MIRLLLRFLGFWLFAGALALAVIDATRSIAGDAVVLTPLSTTIAGLNGSPLTAESTGLSPFLFGLLQDAVLGQPAFAVLGVVGLVLILLSRRRRRAAIGYEAA